MAGHYFVCGEDTPNPIVQCFTTKGPLSIEVYRDWAPLGADRFLELVKDNFFTDIAFFRCVNRFLTQFGISDNPEKKHWHRQSIKDDPNKGLGIKKHYVSFAGGGPNTRSSQIFIAFEDLDFLGKEPWETPFGKVIVGQDTLDNLYKEYGDIPPFGEGPDQQEIFREGNAYVREFFPHIDFIQSCSMLEDIDPDADREEDAESLADAGLGGAAVGKGPTDDALVIEGGHELTPEDIANEQSELDGEEVAVTATSNYEVSIKPYSNIESRY